MAESEKKMKMWREQRIGGIGKESWRNAMCHFNANYGFSDKVLKCSSQNNTILRNFRHKILILWRRKFFRSTFLARSSFYIFYPQKIQSFSNPLHQIWENDWSGQKNFICKAFTCDETWEIVIWVEKKWFFFPIFLFGIQ